MKIDVLCNDDSCIHYNDKLPHKCNYPYSKLANPVHRIEQGDRDEPTCAYYKFINIPNPMEESGMKLQIKARSMKCITTNGDDHMNISIDLSHDQLRQMCVDNGLRISECSNTNCRWYSREFKRPCTAPSTGIHLIDTWCFATKAIGTLKTAHCAHYYPLDTKRGAQ